MAHAVCAVPTINTVNITQYSPERAPAIYLSGINVAGLYKLSATRLLFDYHFKYCTICAHADINGWIVSSKSCMLGLVLAQICPASSGMSASSQLRFFMDGHGPLFTLDYAIHSLWDSPLPFLWLFM